MYTSIYITPMYTSVHITPMYTSVHVIVNSHMHHILTSFLAYNVRVCLTIANIDTLFCSIGLF